ncbi:hypothetical protein CONPUDRAFT_156307 [Coniophora puteana RWD-64-598 SS2]|uniref:Uncharacterized protein n=1 Tax=Coniophora puteana (strain RWD-64-598) TaxID=741705 RepID=A0A5M3MI49_CONPW|nr:uncharacterized protein CONPUDRAFT_156307 [Coniophora puteana RWD-64-598 SS2]EIW78311.1 hypothetical protein CONPUDRAFT_156307 [Coniophora puteana RWD-64-598 SS2]
MHQVNARMVFKRNNTDVFMETLTDKQHEFLVQTTRQVDASGIEKKRRKELTEHKARTAVKKREAQERFSQRKEKKKQRLDELELILDEKVLDGLNREELDGQWDLHRRDNNTLPAKNSFKLKKNILIALKAQTKITCEALAKQAHVSELRTPASGGSHSGGD